MALDDKLTAAQGILDRAMQEHKPRAVFALFSGGHDSLTSVHFAMNAIPFDVNAVVHINTGIGIPQTRQFVIDTCASFGWKLLEYKATENTKADGTPDPQVYEDIVVKHGFPGPFAHNLMYRKLKERQIARLVREHKQHRHDRIMLITGVRKHESKRRMGTVEEIARQGAVVWVAPFADMTSDDQAEYMARYALPRNPVKEVLCMSGECLCGAFAKPGELNEIRTWYPEVAARIEAIEAKVKAAGFSWGWNEAPPRQKKPSKKKFEPLCVSCNVKFENEQEDQAPVISVYSGEYAWLAK